MLLNIARPSKVGVDSFILFTESSLVIKMRYLVEFSSQIVSSLITSGFVFWQQAVEIEVAPAAGSQPSRSAAAAANCTAGLSVTKRPNQHAADFLLRYHLNTHGAVDYPLIAIIDPRTNELVQVRLNARYGYEVVTQLLVRPLLKASVSSPCLYVELQTHVGFLAADRMAERLSDFLSSHR